jgi:DNA-binding transcriptional regulator Cro
MTYADLIAHYGTPSAAAAARGIDRQRVNGWRIRDRIPIEDQIEYEVLTNGALRADLPEAIRQPLAGNEQAAA